MSETDSGQEGADGPKEKANQIPGMAALRAFRVLRALKGMRFSNFYDYFLETKFLRLYNIDHRIIHISWHLHNEVFFFLRII